jgi:hypothetical protein
MKTMVEIRKIVRRWDPQCSKWADDRCLRETFLELLFIIIPGVNRRKHGCHAEDQVIEINITMSLVFIGR